VQKYAQKPPSKICSVSRALYEFGANVEVTRKPHQIILIEHLLYPVMGFIFFVLNVSYIVEVASIHTELQPSDINEICMAIGGCILAIICIIVLPYSCTRLWKSSNIHLKGLFWKRLSKFYSGFLLTMSIVYGILMLIAMPSLFSLAVSI
jgi:hypothetical protein